MPDFRNILAMSQTVVKDVVVRCWTHPTTERERLNTHFQCFRATSGHPMCG